MVRSWQTVNIEDQRLRNSLSCALFVESNFIGVLLVEVDSTSFLEDTYRRIVSVVWKTFENCIIIIQNLCFSVKIFIGCPIDSASLWKAMKFET